MSIKNVGTSCCACRTCKAVCSFEAISVITDRYGFEQMSVDKDKCRECGMCEKVCPALHADKSSQSFSCGAAYALNDEVKLQGSSGGLFGTFARQIIYDGGIVYGAAFDNELKLRTTAATTIEELGPLYKSKYLLCDTNNSFTEIKAKLEQGIKVLYCSSPCQISALKLFLNARYDNLLTVEFVCHGVGSQTLFDKSIAYSEKKMNAEISRVSFRNKFKNAATHYYYYYYCKKKTKYFSRQGLYLSFPYYNAYCKRLVYRSACYDCKYATEERVADITIGDFHNIEKYDSSIDRFAGVSMFVCNTKKGEEFFNSVKDKLFVKLYPWDTIKINNRFSQGEVPPKDHDAFMEAIAVVPFKTVVKKYLSPIRDWKWIIYYKSPAFLRKIIRKHRR